MRTFNHSAGTYLGGLSRLFYFKMLEASPKASVTDSARKLIVAEAEVSAWKRALNVVDSCVAGGELRRVLTSLRTTAAKEFHDARARPIFYSEEEIEVKRARLRILDNALTEATPARASVSTPCKDCRLRFGCIPEENTVCPAKKRDEEREEDEYTTETAWNKIHKEM